MKKYLIVIFGLMIIALSSCGKKEKEHNVTKKELTVYESAKDKYNINAYFIDDIDSPYMKIDDILEHRMSKPEEIGLPIPNLKLSYSNGILKANNTYKNKVYTVEFDAINDKIKSKNYSKAIDIFGYGVPCDLLGADRSPITISIAKEIEDTNDELVFDLGKFGVELVSYENTVLIPFYLLSNIYFIMGEKSFAYNGENIYKTDTYSSPSTLVRGEDLFMDFYHIKSIERNPLTIIYDEGYTANKPLNQATINFNRGAILETFSDFFGRKDEIGYDIVDFAKVNGYYDLMSSDKPADILKGLGGLAESIDDLHTNINSSSAYAGYIYLESAANDAFFTAKDKGQGYRAQSYWLAKEKNETDRNKIMGEDLAKDGFYYQGETLFIRFGSFYRAKNSEVFSGNKLNQVEYTSNTFNLFYDAFNDLKNHPEIKNIVIDEAINGGGDVTTEVEIAGFFMDEVHLHMMNNMTKQQCDLAYKVDTNLDGKYDSNDCPGKNYNVYILCTEASFSAGNNFPAVIRNNKAGKVIGRTTAGGACCVGFATSPIGDAYRFSGYAAQQIINDDGLHYSADYGVHPDYYLENDVCYNQEALNNFLNGLS